MNPHKMPFIGKLRKSVKSLHKLDDRGLLYEMDYYADYRLFMKLISRLVTSSGCSTFTAKTPDGDRVMYRNYDFPHYRNADDSDVKNISGLNILLRVKSRNAKYKSIGMVDGYWMDSKHGSFCENAFEDGKSDISMLALLPFLCMDGMNEVGLTVSIMFLPCALRWDEAEYIEPDTLEGKAKEQAKILTVPGALPDMSDLLVKHGTYCINTADKKAWTAYRYFSTCQKEPGKKTVFHPVLMRLMLDSCATVDEAIALSKTVNIKSPMPDSDFHIMVADASGKTVVLEWVDNKLVVVETDHATNFYLSDPNEKGGDRYVIMEEAIKNNPQGITELEGKDILQEISQDIRIGKRLSMTQWSAIYNMKQKTVKLWAFQNYDKCYEYRL